MKFYLAHIIFFIIGISYSNDILSQSILINQDGGKPDSSAILEVRSDNKGVLIPRMVELNRINIPSPAKSLLVYQTNGVQGFYYFDGVQWDTLDGNSAVNRVTSVNNTKSAIIKEVKPSGVNGGTFLAGSWVSRDLNQLEGDTSFIQIDGVSSFTLDSGLYEISAIAPARQVGAHQIRLFNLDANTLVANGTSVNSAAASTTSELYIVFKIESETEFEIQHRGSIDSSDDTGLGWAIPWGESVFTVVKVQQFD